MKTKIFIVSYTSFTESDNYLHSEQKTFINPLFAQDYFDETCNNAREECRWGSQYDEPEDDRDEDCTFDVTEERQGDVAECHACYIVESEAYEGYKVCVKLEAVEIEIPVFAVCYASHAREDYDDYLHMDDPQLFTSKSEARKEYEGMKNYAEATAANEYDDAGDGKVYRPEIETDEDDEGNEIAATIKRTDNPLSIYTGRVELHQL